MQANVTGLRAILLGAAVAIGSMACVADAAARPRTGHDRSSRSALLVHGRGGEPGAKHARIGGHGRKYAAIRSARFADADQAGADLAGGDAPTYSYGGMSCVPFARANSGIELAGNAWSWWSNAAGVYERGSRPEVGSVLNFRSNGRMRSGHVAVVTNVENGRVIDIDHANWSGPGAITRNVRVVDVSAFNDWSAVRVALGRSGDFGSVYPTYGFIYDRPDHGTLVANTNTAPMPSLANAAPRDLRPALEQVDAVSGDDPVEVAEATPRASYRRAAFFHASTFHAGAARGRHGLVQRVKAAAPSHAAPPHAGLSGRPAGRKHTRG